MKYRIYSTKRKKYIKEISGNNFDFCSKKDATLFSPKENAYQRIKDFCEAVGDELYLRPEEAE